MSDVENLAAIRQARWAFHDLLTGYPMSPASRSGCGGRQALASRGRRREVQLTPVQLAELEAALDAGLAV
jgi:hypothetical protein